MVLDEPVGRQLHQARLARAPGPAGQTGTVLVTTVSRVFKKHVCGSRAYTALYGRTQLPPLPPLLLQWRRSQAEGTDAHRDLGRSSSHIPHSCATGTHPSLCEFLIARQRCSQPIPGSASTHAPAPTNLPTCSLAAGRSRSA